jgi:hypothetical protein
LLFKHKSILKIDLADLEAEKENLASFLQSHFQLNSSINHRGLELNVDIPAYSLATMVKKFIYHKNLNITHWVTVENNEVKIVKFKSVVKKKEKHKKSSPHQTLTQSWGL